MCKIYNEESIQSGIPSLSMSISSTPHPHSPGSVLAGSFKRINNIIKENTDTHVDPTLLCEAAEQALHDTLVRVKAEMETHVAEGNYAQALQAMLQMKEPVDSFFDDVMVMTDDLALQKNRLNLLTALGQLVLNVGDISKMHRE